MCQICQGLPRRFITVFSAVTVLVACQKQTVEADPGMPQAWRVAVLPVRSADPLLVTCFTCRLDWLFSNRYPAAGFDNFQTSEKI